ncbi:MAG: phage tail protein [Candidatus Paceibacterota bacterium]
MTSRIRHQPHKENITPGFIVATDVGAGIAATENNLKPVYQYTWEIVNLFEDNRNLFPTKLLAKEATLPTFTITKDTVDGSSLVYKYAGMVTWEDIRITFYDVVVGSNKASQIIKDWREKVWSVKTGLSSPVDYKKDSVIKVYNLDFSAWTTWTLYGSWPQSVKEGDLTYTATEIKVIDVTIAYDWADSSSDSNYVPEGY